MTTTPTPVHRTLASRCNDLANDVVLTMGRMDEALDLLKQWAAEHPDGHLARMSLNLIRRCEETR